MGRPATARQYGRKVGMGLIRSAMIGSYAAAAEIDDSHIDGGAR